MGNADGSDSSGATMRTVLLVFFLAIALGGANAVAIRFTVKELPPFWGAALRFGGAAVICWAISLARRAQLPPARGLPALVLFGLLNFGVAWAFIYTGLRTVEAGMAQVLMALTPLLTFFFAILHRQEAFRWRGLAGAVVALAGVALVFLEHPKGGAALLPMLSIIAGAACLGEGIVLLKRLPPMDPFILNASAMTIGAAGLLAFSRLMGETWRAPGLPVTWIAVLYLIVVGTVVFFSLLTYVIKRWKASASAYALVIMPLETVALSAWLTGEHLEPSLLLGGVLVLLGVWVGALSSPKAKPKPDAVAAVPVVGEAD